jgi:hypothetical protein
MANEVRERHREYRKKPVVVHAVQWTGINLDEVLDMCLTTGSVRRGIGSESSSLFIDTLEGTMRADKMDWIIRGVKDELYPCKPDIFEQLYVRNEAALSAGERAEAPAQPSPHAIAIEFRRRFWEVVEAAKDCNDGIVGLGDVEAFMDRVVKSYEVETKTSAPAQGGRWRQREYAEQCIAELEVERNRLTGELEQAKAELTAIRIIFDGPAGAAINACREDYPQWAERIGTLQAELAAAKHEAKIRVDGYVAMMDTIQEENDALRQQLAAAQARAE